MALNITLTISVPNIRHVANYFTKKVRQNKQICALIIFFILVV